MSTKKTERRIASSRGKGKPSPGPTKPAATVARSPELRKLEEGERKLNFIVKTLEADGPDAAVEALKIFQTAGYDPVSHSQQSVVALGLLDGLIEHGEAMSGRKIGAFAPETLFLEQLMEHFRHEDTLGLWSKLRTIAANPSDRHNPTPGTCPFTHGFNDRGMPAIYKRGKPYLYETFRNALSAIRRRRANALSK